MGSEMCIRDSRGSGLAKRGAVVIEALIPTGRERPVGKTVAARCATRVA